MRFMRMKSDDDEDCGVIGAPCSRDELFAFNLGSDAPAHRIVDVGIELTPIQNNIYGALANLVRCIARAVDLNFLKQPSRRLILPRKLHSCQMVWEVLELILGFEIAARPMTKSS